MSSSEKFSCKGTLRQAFLRVYRPEIQSVVLVFSTQLCVLLVVTRLTFSLVQFSPCPPSLYCLHVYSVGIWDSGPRQDNTCRKVPLQVHFFRWRHYYEFYLSTALTITASSLVLFLVFLLCVAVTAYHVQADGREGGWSQIWRQQKKPGPLPIYPLTILQYRAGIFKESMGARNRGGIGL
jgi:hypothetical protein